MAAMRTPGIVLLLLAAPLALADMPGCGCDPADAKSMEPRECSLSREALAQPSGKPVLFVKDINPRKPNRWLAMPSVVRKGENSLSEMSPQARLALWTDAIQKAKELWGENWALAYNGDDVRTQCQPHLHIGKLIEGVETPRFRGSGRSRRRFPCRRTARVCGFTPRARSCTCTWASNLRNRYY